MQRTNDNKSHQRYFSFEEGLEHIQEILVEKLKDTIDAKKDIGKKDKKYLREKVARYKKYVTDIVFQEDMRIRGYENEKIKDFIQFVTEDIAGYSVLQKAFEDPDVSDIFCISWNNIWIEKDGKDPEVYPYTFRSSEHYKNVVERFLSEAGKELNMAEAKEVNFELYGDRCTATHEVISPASISLTIRKHSEDKVTKKDLLKKNVLNEEMASLFELLIKGQTNLVYGGITGSGKTTSIRALLEDSFQRLQKRVLVCEDTQELFFNYLHTLSLVSTKKDDKNPFTLMDSIYLSLRLKPRYIVTGEIRGEEAKAYVEAAETGHASITTMHGGTPWNIINRLTTKFLQAMPSLSIEVVERIIGSALDYIFIQDDIPGTGRRMTYFSEVSYDFEKQTIVIKPIFEYDFFEQRFVQKGKISKEKAHKMLRRGVSVEEIKPWMEEA